MKGNKKIYNIFQKLSAAFMVATLLWLTVSAPVVLAWQQELAKQEKTANAQSPLTANEEETNPFGSNKEGKTSVGNSLSEEYLHDCHLSPYLLSVASQYNKCENAGTYTAFHGELLVPPPNAA